MSGSVNKAIILGQLGRDPEARHLQNGDKVVNMSVATSDRWTDRQSGEKKENTAWHRIVIFDQNLADVAEKYLRKGSSCYLEGSLQTRRWTDQSGTEKFSTEIVLQRFRGVLTLLDSPNGGGERQQRQAPAQQPGMDLDEDDIEF